MVGIFKNPFCVVLRDLQYPLNYGYLSRSLIVAFNFSYLSEGFAGHISPQKSIAYTKAS